MTKKKNKNKYARVPVGFAHYLRGGAGPHKDRKKELVSFEEDFLGVNEARSMARIALEILRRRDIVRIKNDTISINKKNFSFIEYYANLLHYEG